MLNETELVDTDNSLSQFLSGVSMITDSSSLLAEDSQESRHDWSGTKADQESNIIMCECPLLDLESPANSREKV